jgi:two-component system LytT family response regulator
MTSLHFIEEDQARQPVPNAVREYGYGFLYWLVFLLVLEPDNAFRAIRSGHELAFDHEALRITAASLLGASVTSVLLLLTRRFPVLGPGRWRNALVHTVGTVGLAFGLIVVSCFLAAWVFERKWLPSLAEVHDELISNWVLLVYAIGAFTAIAHAVHFFHRAGSAKTATDAAKRLTRIPVKTRGRLTFLDLADIDWIETQGNYLALHVGSATHMIRETSKRFEEQLDPNRFVRIHRRVIVAVDRIRDLQPVANGDAIVRLLEGCELRASRRYREAIRQKWPGWKWERTRN